jgi:hypothetical protein
VLLLLPLLATAQSDDLRAQIRADLLADPRTAELPPAELEALVAALADEAEATGEAETYLDAKKAPTFTYELPPSDTTNPYVAILTAPIILAILALIAALLGVLFYMLRARGRARKGTIAPGSDVQTPLA